MSKQVYNTAIKEIEIMVFAIIILNDFTSII